MWLQSAPRAAGSARNTRPLVSWKKHSQRTPCSAHAAARSLVCCGGSIVCIRKSARTSGSTNIGKGGCQAQGERQGSHIRSRLLRVVRGIRNHSPAARARRRARAAWSAAGRGPSGPAPGAHRHPTGMAPVVSNEMDYITCCVSPCKKVA